MKFLFHKTHFYKTSWRLLTACLVGGLLSACLLTGCKTSQVAMRSADLGNDTLRWAQTYNANRKPIKARYTLGFTGNQILNLKGEIISVQDQELLISLRALFGWEILQLYCTPEQAVIVDKVRKRVCTLPFSELTPELGVDFYGLQGLLTQGMFDPSGKFFVDFKVKKEGENLVYSHTDKYMTEFLLDATGLLTRTRIDAYQKGSYLLVNYLEPKEYKDFRWSNKMQVLFSDKTKNQSIDLLFTQVKTDDQTSINWQFPMGYTQVPLMDIKREINAL